MSNDGFVKRKHPRLKDFDYSQNGAYFITICSYQKQKIFSAISVGFNGEFVSSPSIYGQIAQKQIEEIKTRFQNIAVDKYVIMPNHIHILMTVSNEIEPNAECSISDVICAFKSITAKQCRRVDPELKVFQTSFHDHVVRNERDYQRIWSYIDTNIQKWTSEI